MKKIIICLVVMLTLVGCASNGTKENSNKAEGDKQEFKNKLIQNIKMKIMSIEASQSGMDDKKKIVEIMMKFKNEDMLPVGIGGGDFKLKIGDKFFDVVSEANNIGQEIEVGKEVKGKLYFEVSEDIMNGILVYSPNKETLGEWEIELPASK